MSVVEIDLTAAAADIMGADALRVKIAAVTNALGSKSKLAGFLGVARSQPGKWLAGTERPNSESRRHIKDLEYVWDRLTDDQPADVARVWLNSPNSFLDGATPLAWIVRRGPEDVIGAFNAHEAGSYA